MLYKGAPPFSMSALYIIMNFNPRAPCGARLPASTTLAMPMLFQSTRPVWGATHVDTPLDTKRIVSIHAPRVWRDLRGSAAAGGLGVSIHAPRVGRDRSCRMMRLWQRCFNPRAPCGARRVGIMPASWYPSFQSTRPVWGATLMRAPWSCIFVFQSTRPVWGATAKSTSR